MEKYLYNTALKKNNIVTNKNYFLKEKFNNNNKIVMYHNLCDVGIPEEFKYAEMIYSEVSWENGFEKFREKDNFDGEFKDYLKGIANVIKTLNVPTYIVCSSRTYKYLKEEIGNGFVINDFRIRSSVGYLGVFNTKECSSRSCEELMENNKDKCVLDFSCGYGQHLLGLNKFIASDINRYCLGYLKECIK